MSDPAERSETVQESLAELFLRLRPCLRQTAARFRIPADEADDLIQDAALALVRSWSRVEFPEAWLRGALQHLCFLYHRTRRRRPLEFLDLALLEALVPAQRPAQEEAEIAWDLACWSASLSPMFRRLLQLRYVLGWTDREIAARLGYQPDSVRKLRARALKQMRGAVR